MSRFSTSSNLMFDEDEVKATTELLPRLVRIFFFGMQITNDEYLRRYYLDYREKHRDRTRKEFSQKAAADRKFLYDRRKLTFGMMRSVMSAMGYDIEAVSIRARDRLTGDIRNFSTDDTVESLKDIISKDREVGVQTIS